MRAFPPLLALSLILMAAPASGRPDASGPVSGSPAPRPPTGSTSPADGASAPEGRGPAVPPEVSEPVDGTVTPQGEGGASAEPGRDGSGPESADTDPHANGTATGNGGPVGPAAPLTVAGVEVWPGQKREIRLPTSESFAAADVDIPLVVIRGREPGPVLCLTAGIHGDELNGIQIVNEILETHSPDDLRGTLVGIPVVNLFGFTNQSRYLPDRRDLNRYFPGRPRGSTASRIAWRLWDGVLRHCTHLVDLHTGSLHRSNVAQVRGDLTNEAVADLARAFGARSVIHNPGQRGTLRRTATDAGIPAILYEAGETMRFQKDHIRRGVLGVRNVMVHLGLRDGRRVDVGEVQQFLETHWVRAPQGGILDLYPGLGEWVEAGDILGVISDPLRKRKGLVTSPYTGRIIGKVLSPMVIPGMAIVHVGVPGGRADASDAVEEEMDADRPE